MYPNIYYLLRDWFGVSVPALSFINSFGLMVAFAFIGAAWTLTLELKRKEKAGLLLPREEMINVGKPASMIDLLLNAITGFLFGYKLGGLFFLKPADMPAQDYIFSREGSVLAGLALGAVLVYLKWREKKKQQLPVPENRAVRIWPHDRVGDFVILALVFGILGAKLFDNLENWDEFIQHPLEHIFSASGLTFYGGLIVAAVAVCWFAYKKGIRIKHLVDAAAPGLMLAYAIGRIGCQVSGDGDWGILNSAYVSDANGHVRAANSGEFKQALKANETYYLQGKIEEKGRPVFVTDRVYPSLAEVPHKSFKGPDFLPAWFFAYSYPQNVNNDGIDIPGNADEHHRTLPSPVFPTPLYETIICGILFFFLWGIRKWLKTPLMMFGIYLVVNGLERFFIETMRVNHQYNVLGWMLTQAEIIALGLVLAGIGLMGWSKLKIKQS